MLDGIGENISFANAILACILLGTYDYCLGALRLIDAIYHLIQTTHALNVLRIYIEKVGLKGCFLRDALDFLSVQDNVDAERIGIIGICGFGGMAVNAAALDPRIKATVAMTMAAGIIAAMPEVSSLSPIHLACITAAVAGGATVCSHFNDSGFWLVKSLVGMDEKTTLKTWTLMETLVGATGFLVALVISWFA